MPTTPARQPHDLMQLLTRADRLSARRLQTVLDETGCSLDAWRVMTLLSDGEGHHMTSVADCAFLPPPSLTKLVDQLVDQNLVYRRVDPLDRRRILAYLTPRGLALWRQLDGQVRDSWAALPSTGDDELLGTLLVRLVDALDGVPAVPSR